MSPQRTKSTGRVKATISKQGYASDDLGARLDPEKRRHRRPGRGNPTIF
jgi:hypothetical protein